MEMDSRVCGIWGITAIPLLGKEREQRSPILLAPPTQRR